MKVKLLFTFLSFFFICNKSFSQKENNVWIFGNNLGINFNTAPPSLTSSPMRCYESCASVCDNSGNLRFYSNGLNVWDNSNNIMPNGSGLLGCDGGLLPGANASATFGAAIVPILGYPDLYYLFTLQEQELFTATPPSYKGELRYSIIDMKLNGGKGDIITGKKNILVDSQMSERMTVVKADCGVWLITHHNDKHTFFSYKIDSKDSIHKRVVSDFATTIVPKQYMVGQMKSSPDGTKIAISTNGKNSIELLDFNNSTGILSNLRLIESGRPSAYSVEFSEDNSKLYTVGFNGNIAQYDLSLLPSVSAVIISQYIVNTANYYSSLRLAPNGKIYTQGMSLNEIGVINLPNLSGAACNFIPKEPTLKNTNTLHYASFGNKTVSIDNIEIASRTLDTNICDTDKVVIKGSPLLDGFLWNDGDTAREKTISVSGKYWRSANYKCAIINDTFIINFIEKSTEISRFDTTLCMGASLTLSLDNAYKSIEWNDFDTSRVKTIYNSGIYYRKSEKNCVIYIDSFLISFKKNDSTYFKHDSVICFREETNIESPAIAETYLWNDGVNTKYNQIKDKETKWVWAHNDKKCWVQTDSFEMKRIWFQSNIRNTFICKDEEINIDASIENATRYLWKNGLTASSFSTKEPGEYWVEIAIDNCSLKDSFTINSKQLFLDLGDDKVLCKGESAQISTKINDAIYQWSSGENTASIIVKEKGQYSVIVQKNGCTEKDDIMVDIIQCDNCVAIPNAFTPNNDNKNDRFLPIFNCPVQRYELMIVNRYGQVIFKSQNVLEGWDGQFNGQNLDLGVYYFLINVTYNYPNAKNQIYKGDITLIR